MSKNSSVLLGIALAVLIIAAAIIYYVADMSMHNPAPGGGELTRSGKTHVVTPTGTAYTIGVIFDITGTGQGLGVPERDTLNMLVDDINKTGINGHPIKLVIEDNASDSATGVSKLKKLIEQDKVVAVIGTSQTGTTMPLLDVIKDKKIPLISCAAGNKIVNPVQPFVFKTAQSDILAVGADLAYLKSKGLTDIAVINADSDYGKSGLDQLQKQSKDAGINIVDTETFNDKDTDVSAQVIKLGRSTAKAVVCWGISPGSAKVAKAMSDNNIKLPLLLSHGVANKTFIDNAGKDADGVIFPAGKLLVLDQLPDSDAQKKVLKDYSDAFNKKYSKAPDTFGGHAYDALTILCNALKAADSSDPAKLRDAIEKTSGYVGISGTFNYTAGDHNGLTKDCFAMVTIKDGKWEPVK